MNFVHRRALLVVGLIAAMLLTGMVYRARAQAANGGRIRLVHAVPGAPAVDISIDGVVAVRGLAYASATRYLNVASGDHTLAVAAGGANLFQGKVSVTPAQAVTVLIQGTPTAVETGVYEDDLGPVAAGNMRLTALHAMKDAPAVDLLRGDGSPLMQGVKYGAPYGAFDIPAMAASILVVPAGSDAKGALLKLDGVPLVGGTYNTLVALGTVSGTVKPSYLLLTAATDAEKPDASIWLSFVNAASGGQAVDVYVGDKLIVPTLAFGSATPRIALPSAGSAVTVRAAGSAATSPALTTIPDVAKTGNLAAGGAGTVVISNGAEAMGIGVVKDNNAALDPKTARLNVVNAAGGKGTATLHLGDKVLVNDASKGSASAEVPAGTYKVAVSVDQPALQLSDTLSLSGGVLYDLIVAGSDQNSKLIVVATGINEQPLSAPPAGAIEIAQATTPTTVAAAPTLAPTSAAPVATTAVPATLVPTTVAAAPTTAPAQATAVPQPTAAPTTIPDVATSVPAPTDNTAPQPTTPPQPTAVSQPSTSQGITAVVNLNEGVNLKIREYPRIDARTLALVPSGSTLTVVGIRGPVGPAGTAIPNTTPTAGPTPTLSATGVSPDNLWLFVTWNVSDGGNVSGWTIAQFLKISRNGKAVREVVDIMTFKEIPPTTPGEIASAAVTPIAETNNIIGTVTVNEGTNLQLRRTPGLTGESLALIPANATVIVLQQTTVASQGGVVGEPKSTIWLWVRYETESGAVTGWVNSSYVTMTRRGRKVDMTEIPVAKEIQRGFIEGNATAVKPPPAAGLIATVDKVNQGANLQLRRDPDAAAESLALVPAGTELPVLGRNADGTWLKVSFQDKQGWINSQFVTVTKSGRKYNIADITNISGQPNVIGTITPGPSPTPLVTATPGS